MKLKGIRRMRILPSRQKLNHFLGDNDFYLWEYYGESILGRMQAWIFRSRIEALIRFLNKNNSNLGRIIDIGCGPMFISYALTRETSSEYLGIDIMQIDRLRKYRDIMRNEGIKNIEAVRASAEFLPFRTDAFDLALALDVLEHLKEPRKAIREIHYAIKNGGMVAVSLPLENLFQRNLRLGFALMKMTGDPILKGSRHVPITKTPNYHYVGNVKSYNEMVMVLKETFNLLHTEYTPIGFHKSVNVNAVHCFQNNK